MNILENGKLMVKSELNDIYEVKVHEVSEEMIMSIDLIPNEYSLNNGVNEYYLTVDLLNENIVQVLKENGYLVIKEKQIKQLQN